jgi:hypothetical protein
MTRIVVQPNTADRLQRMPDASGLSTDQLLQSWLIGVRPPTRVMPDAWHAEVDRWVSQHQTRAGCVDDSRDSIHERDIARYAEVEALEPATLT